MALELYGKVGPVRGSTGLQQQVRLGLDGEAVITQAHAKYYEAVKRGNVYRAQTAVTGVAPGTAVGTTAAAALYNPVDSGYDLVLLQTSMAYVSGTLGSGLISYCANINSAAAATTGTAVTEVNAQLGKTAANVGQMLTTATLPTTPVVIGNFVSMTPILATSVTAPYTVIDEVDGAIVIKPGATLSLQQTGGAGTAPLVTFAFVWEEVAI